MTTTNTFSGTCACGVSVPAGTGQAYEQAGRFRVRCPGCAARDRARSSQADLPPVLVLPGTGFFSGKITVKTDKPAGWAYSVFAEACKRAGAELSKAMGPWSEFSCSHEAAGDVLAALRESGFRLDPSPELIAQVLAKRDGQARSLEVTDTRLEAIEQELQARGKFLFGFQRVGAGWLGSRGPTPGGSGAMLCDEMGLGKTIQLLAACPVQAPVQVICPAGGIGTWEREAAAWRPDFVVRITENTKPGSFSWPESGQLVITPFKRLPRLIPGPPKPGTIVIVDECFPPGTLVDTLFGLLEIEHLKPGDTVMSALGPANIRSVMSRPAPDVMALVYFSCGLSITCTAGHRIFTDRGWICAADLEPGDDVLSGDESLRLVQGIVSDYSTELEDEILRHELLREVEDATARSSRQGFFAGYRRQDRSNTSVDQCHGSAAWPGYITENDRRQSDARPGYAIRCVGYAQEDQAQAQSLGRKRSWSDRGRSAAGYEVWSDSELCRQYVCSERNRLSDSLQAGLGRPRDPARGRGRWPVSLFHNGSGLGLEKSFIPYRARVDRVEIHQRGGDGGYGPRGRFDRVYNLEVEGHPSYCVNGLLVHNCHEIKNPKSIQGMRTRAHCRLARESGGASWGSTATPMLNRPDELWDVMDCFGLARECYRTYPDFVRAFGGKRNQDGKLVYLNRPPAEASQRLARGMLRREKSEVMTQLPEKLWETVLVELPVKISAQVELACQAALDKIKASGRDPDAALQALVSGEQIPGAAELSQANQMLALAKTERMLELVSEYESSDTPLVVFSCHRAPVEALQGRPGWGAIIGGGSTICGPDGVISGVAPRVVEDAFQAGKLRGCAGTVKAMGTVYTLTRASNELWVDRPWTPGLEDQAEDRCHRIGQTRGVLIRRLVTTHPLEKKFARLLDMKRKIIEGSVSAASIPDLASADQLVAGPLDRLIKILTG